MIQDVKRTALLLLQFLGIGYLMTAVTGFSDEIFRAGRLSPAMVVVVLGLSAVQLAVFIWYAHYQGLLVWDRQWLTGRDILRGIGGVGLLVLSNAATQHLLDVVGLGIETTANQEAILSLFGSYSTYLLFVQGVLLAPFYEEIVFRGIIGRLLCQGTRWGYLLSATLFAFLHHPTDIGSFVVYAVPGLLLYFLYQKYQRLQVPIVAHMLMNALAFVVSYAVQSGWLN